MSKGEARNIIHNAIALSYSQFNLGIEEQYRGLTLDMAIWPSVCPSYAEQIPICLLVKDPSMIELNMHLEPAVTTFAAFVL